MAPAGRSRNATPPSKFRRMVNAVNEDSPMVRWVTVAGVMVTMLATLYVAFSFLIGATNTPHDVDRLSHDLVDLRGEVHALRDSFEHSEVSGLRPAEVNGHLSAIDHRFDIDEERLRADEEKLSRLDAIMGLGTRGK